MTKAEALAFNAGVEATLEHARKVAQAVARLDLKPVRKELAIAALDEFAEAGRALIITVDVPTSQRQH